MVAAVRAEMADVGLEPTATEETLLATAAVLVDRMAVLEARVAADGEVLVSKTGVIRVHPAATEHRQLAATLPKVLSGVVVGDSTSGKNPSKVAAARSRWDSRSPLDVRTGRGGL